VFVNRTNSTANSITLKVPISHYQGTAEENILLDTGATDNLIDVSTVNKLRLETKRIKPQAVYNVDRTFNRNGTITQACNLLVTQGNKKERTRFYVMNIGRD